MRAPWAIAVDTSAAISSKRLRSDSPPPATWKRPRTTYDSNPGYSPSTFT
ncbi:unannotated protein [freshwater metagenome]|uniref:Unannotated protein n=1 Tax=freshwater metagenome TaxID=449393 RepID=A0A6J6NMR9_9ZZZZ